MALGRARWKAADVNCFLGHRASALEASQGVEQKEWFVRCTLATTLPLILRGDLLHPVVGMHRISPPTRRSWNGTRVVVPDPAGKIASHRDNRMRSRPLKRVPRQHLALTPRTRFWEGCRRRYEPPKCAQSVRSSVRYTG